MEAYLFAFVAEVPVGALLQEEPHQLWIAGGGGQVKGRPPLTVGKVDVGCPHEKELQGRQVTDRRGPVKDGCAGSSVFERGALENQLEHQWVVGSVERLVKPLGCVLGVLRLRGAEQMRDVFGSDPAQLVFAGRICRDGLDTSLREDGVDINRMQQSMLQYPVDMAVSQGHHDLRFRHARRKVTSTRAGSQLSSVRERILEMWTPNERWMPEHSMQIRIPKLIHAQVGESALQSAQLSFPGSVRIFSKELASCFDA